MAYELTLDTYQGPLDKLLELIEGEKLSITRVNLAKVTGGFLAYVASLEEASATGAGVDPQVVADFLVVASKLILIKSKALLPSLEITAEEAEDIRDLESRLTLYQELRATQRYVRERWHVTPVMAHREFLQTVSLGFLPPTGTTVSDLAASVRRVIGELEKLLAPTASLRVEFANLQAKIQEVLGRLTGSGSAQFSALASDGGNRRELVTLFLAVLHLVKDQLVSVSQGGHFTDITIARCSGKPVQ